MLQQVLARLESEMDCPPEERTAVINQHLLSTLDYRHLQDADREPIDYSDPGVRFAYIFKYVTAHAKLVSDIMGRSDVLQTTLRAASSVTCLGGGPGSELLGLSEAAAALRRPDSLHAMIFDQEPAWLSDWALVVQAFHLPVSYMGQALDVCDPRTWRSLRTPLSRAELITSVFFLSEVFAQRKRASAFLDQLGDLMAPGAVFFYLDNAGQAFYHWAEEIFRAHGFTELERGQNLHWAMPLAERVKDLGEYSTRFAHTPTLKRQVAWHVLRKEPA